MHRYSHEADLLKTLDRLADKYNNTAWVSAERTTNRIIIKIQKSAMQGMKS